MSALARYFDLRPRLPGVTDGQQGSPWLWQYVALVAGIVVQPFLAEYQHSHEWVLTGFWGRVAFAIVVGITVFPAVYKNAFDPGKPLFVQLCAIFAAGMGWESLLRTAVQTVTRPGS